MPRPKVWVNVDWDNDGEIGVDSQDDITGDVIIAEVTGLGKDKELGKAQATILALTVGNEDDKFSPPNAASELNTGGRTLEPGKPIEVITAYPFDSFIDTEDKALASHVPDYDSEFAWSVITGSPVIKSNKAAPGGTGAMIALL